MRPVDPGVRPRSCSPGWQGSWNHLQVWFLGVWGQRGESTKGVSQGGSWVKPGEGEGQRVWLELCGVGGLRGRIGGHGWAGALLEQNTPSPMRLSRAGGCPLAGRERAASPASFRSPSSAQGLHPRGESGGQEEEGLF